MTTSLVSVGQCSRWGCSLQLRPWFSSTRCRCSKLRTQLKTISITKSQIKVSRLIKCLHSSNNNKTCVIKRWFKNNNKGLCRRSKIFNSHNYLHKFSLSRWQDHRSMRYAKAIKLIKGDSLSMLASIIRYRLLQAKVNASLSKISRRW